jgi:hypothetical protein
LSIPNVYINRQLIELSYAKILPRRVAEKYPRVDSYDPGLRAINLEAGLCVMEKDYII